MKTICFYFQIHQPFRLKRYRFFDIGNDHYYYDDFANDDIITRIAQRSYLPANATLLEMIKNANGKFKVAFSISGVALEQLEVCVPEFIDSMKELVKTDCVEFLSETYAHSLASLCDPEEFKMQVRQHDEKIEKLFRREAQSVQKYRVDIFRRHSLYDSFDGIQRRYYRGSEAYFGLEEPELFVQFGSCSQAENVVEKLQNE